ncbi:hypothetical protein B0A50_03345 [Salinomyces thailandicus]|uniref:RRM domain-containing protein n=1 Tax=Salinomyces thailandicus TaxID=706561 RepID=A0A4U0U2F3_9PEZI|nr:hypothetical protein B0A50_03345 [Salinomyces thailandica]
MSGPRHYDQDKDSTLYIGNLDERCTDAIVWELMLQAGPVLNVHLPKDRVTQTHQGYGFVELASEEDADYAAKIMNQIRLWGKPIRVNKASADRRTGGPGADGQGLGGSQGVGAELFVGNLDGMVDEKILFETFSRFGPLIAPPKIARDEGNLSKGFGFISYASFEASDDAVANMHGQYLMNREVTVQYAYKKDGKGERHGDQAERALAANAKRHGVQVVIPAMPASLVMPNGAPSAPAAMTGGYPGPAHAAPPAMGRTPQPPPSYNYGAYQPPPAGMGGGMGGGYPSMPPTPTSHTPFAPPQAMSPQGMPQGMPPGMPPQGMPLQHQAPPPRPFQPSTPLQAPPAGLPARPPPSVGGYGGPTNAPGMQPSWPRSQNGPPGGPPGAPPGAPPGGPPSGFAPPPMGFRPPGPPGPPNGAPQGYQGR